jgi:succinoglycan biosynthesis transport protein ExoP
MPTKPKRPAPRRMHIVLARGWKLIAGTAIVFGLAALAISLLQKPEYEATTTLYVTSGGTVVPSAADSVVASKERVGSIAQLAYTQSVLMPAVQAAGLNLSMEQARERVSVDVNPQVVLVTLSGRDSDPAVAQKFTDALAKSMSTAVSQLEVPGAGTEPLAKMRQVTTATVDPTPVKPTTLINVLLAVAAGLIIGTLLALSREFLNNKVRDETDAEAALGAPVLTVVPSDDQGQEDDEDRVFDFDGQPTAITASFRTLRTQLAVQDPPIRTLLITSARPSEGKTAVAVNAGAVLAQAASSVVVVDANLDDPDVAKRLGASSDGPGLTDAIRGASLPDLIQRGVAGVDTLAVLGAGTKVSDHPADLFSSPAFRKVLDELSQQFDYVIVDSAALLENSATEAILPSVDSVVVASRQSAATMTDLVECRTQLSNTQARVAGLVFFQAQEKRTNPRTKVNA